MDVLVDSERVIAGGVECRPLPGESDAWSYLSIAPWPQLTPAAEPMGSFFEVGDVAMAQLSCQLDPPGTVLEEVRHRLRALGGGRHQVVMRSAVIEVIGVDVVTADGRVLATSRSSGFAPHTAVFQLTLRSDDAAVVGRAMTGDRGLLSIRYQVRASADPHGVVTIEADIADWFGQPSLNHDPIAREDESC